MIVEVRAWRGMAADGMSVMFSRSAHYVWNPVWTWSSDDARWQALHQGMAAVDPGAGITLTGNELTITYDDTNSTVSVYRSAVNELRCS